MVLTFKSAIAVRVVAAEKGVAPVTVDDLIVPAEHLTGRTAAEVFLIMRRAVAVPENVCFGVFGQCYCILETLAELDLLRGIARFVKLPFVDSALVPCR